MILADRRRLRQVRDVIDRSGLASVLSRAAGLDADARGRPRALSVRTLLVGFGILSVSDQTLEIRRLWRTLRSLGEDERRLLRIPRQEARLLPHLTERQVSYLWNKILSAIDPSPHFAAAALEGLSAEEKKAELANRARVLQGALDRLLRASVYGLPGTDTYSLDWTYLSSWARLRPMNMPSPDPDASTVYIEGGLEPKHYLHGYAVHVLTRTDCTDGTPVPGVVDRLVVNPAKGDHAAAAVTAVSSLAADPDVAEFRQLLADRGYTFLVHDRFADPIAALGIDVIKDLHPNQRGMQGSHKGAVAVDGQYFCPLLPDDLVEIKGPDLFGKAESRQAVFDEAERRQRWALAQHGSPNPDGSCRWKCPAAAGKVRCPLKPESMQLPLHTPTMYPTRELKENPPPVCAQKTVTLEREPIAATSQPVPLYTEEWYDLFKRRRRVVETAFSLVKDPGKEHLARGKIRVMGLAKTAFLTAFLFMAVNLRQIDAFNARIEREQVFRVASPRRSRANRAVPFLHRRRDYDPKPDLALIDTS